VSQLRNGNAIVNEPFAAMSLYVYVPVPRIRSRNCNCNDYVKKREECKNKCDECRDSYAVLLLSRVFEIDAKEHGAMHRHGGLFSLVLSFKRIHREKLPLSLSLSLSLSSSFVSLRREGKTPGDQGVRRPSRWSFLWKLRRRSTRALRRTREPRISDQIRTDRFKLN